MGKFKMKGFKAFDMEKNSNNKPDGRAGSSVFQIAGKVYNKFSTSPNKIARITSEERKRTLPGEEGPIIGVPGSARIKRKDKSRKVGKRLVKRSGEKTVNQSSPNKIANQYTRHKSSKSEQADAIARKKMIDRKYADRSPKERAMLANTSQYKGYGAKDELKRMVDTGTLPFGIGRPKQKAQADSPNKIDIPNPVTVAKKLGKTLVNTIGKRGANYKDVMRKSNPNIYNIKEQKSKQPGGGTGTTVTYQIKGEKGEYAINKSRLLKRMAKQTGFGIPIVKNK